MRPLMIISGRQPFEVTLLVAAAVCGTGLILIDTRPRSVSVAMPVVVQAIWEIGLIVGGMVGLLGIGWRGQLSTGLGLELGAVVMLGTTTGMYAIAVFAISGRAGLAAGTFIAAVSAASYWRGGQIIRDLRRLLRASSTYTFVDVPLLMERDLP
ncbi:hypothetical protein OG792_07935 [Micromonospora sp. NBC_01699]|uniref:hypothetical protein n=1 Tax=Micromonospora sp. NBC_01699 TaxID=2975984 RepID=UPI002E310581|nr:hypothetical protein [Micromonospora sp. NBC_01699]